MKNELFNIFRTYLEIFPEEKDNLKNLSKLFEHNIENNENLFNRKNFEGHITASGFIYSINDNEILLLNHKALKKYLQPGGHVEIFDNQLLDTVRREIKEETGLIEEQLISIADQPNVPFDINSHIIPKNDIKNEDEHYHHDFRYLFVLQDKKNIQIDLNESNGYEWVSLDTLEKIDSFKIVILKIKKILKDKKLTEKNFKRN